MIFDVKMEDFRRKARLVAVAGGHMTKAPAAVTYASVVSRETVRFTLTIAVLNEIEVNSHPVNRSVDFRRFCEIALCSGT